MTKTKTNAFSKSETCKKYVFFEGQKWLHGLWTIPYIPIFSCCLRLPNPSFLISVLGLVLETLLCQSAKCHFHNFFYLIVKEQASLFVAGGETCQTIRGTPLRLAQTYISVNARGWRPWCPSIQSSVPLGAGGSFPKIASQRALVARGGLCEFGARSNWPPGMSALIVFPKFLSFAILKISL